MQDDGQEPNSAPNLSDNKKTQWRALFRFTKRRHLIALVPAVCLSVIVGLVDPAMTILLGKFFNGFAQYSSGDISGDEMMRRIMPAIYGFLLLGASMMILQGGAFACWTIFGEMQAKQVREELFQGLLDKDLEWFEMREQGVGNLLTRLQTYSKNAIQQFAHADRC